MVYHWGEWTMEESSPQGLNSQIRSGGGVNEQNENNNQRPPYSMPGILHFIQHEWAKFEMERSQWEVHRAELEVILFQFRIHSFARNIKRIFVLRFENEFKLTILIVNINDFISQ